MSIGYARVSTGDQSLDLQRDALKAAGCSRIFEDVMSGAKPRRPGLDACLQALEPGDTLVVWKLDRLARSLSSLIDVMQHLEKRGIGFRSITQAVDTTTPSGRMMLGILGVVAEFERDLIVERTRAGLAAAKERGVQFGRPTLLTPEALEEAKRLIREEGYSVPKAAAAVGVKKATLYAAIPGGAQALLQEPICDEIEFPE
ncbi:hypothetical protein [Azospirillum argentinense]